MFTNKLFFWLLLGGGCLEVLAQTYGFLWGNKTLASILYFSAGLAVAVIPMLKWGNLTLPEHRRWDQIGRIILGLLLIWGIWCLQPLIRSAPLDYKQADMLPIIRIMAQRWWHGQAIYTPINEIWGGMQPIYLPAMWLPYTLSAATETDLRWMSGILLLFSLLLAYCTPKQIDRLHAGQLLAITPAVLLSIYIFGIYSTLITLSEEPVVVFYYVLLGWALFRQQPILTGVAISLCLLSRYSLIFWVPVYLIYLFFYQSKKAAYLSFGALVVSTAVLLTLGKAWNELSFFLQLQDNYLQELLAEESRWAFVAQLENNPGLVKFLPYELIEYWHRALIWGSLVLPILSLWFFKRWHTRLDTRFFGVCSLKLSMVYFYNMLTIPYSYLFYPSTFLSLLILFAAFAAKRKPANPGNFFGKRIVV